MNKYLLAILLFGHFTSGGQPVVTNASNKRIMEWDSTYNVSLKSFRADFDFERSYYYAVKKNNQIVAEYFRHDDTSYLFVQYDTSGNRIKRGLIKPCNEVLDSFIVQIPDFHLDPDGSKELFKDTIVYDNSYRKNGIWWERDSIGMIWKGRYINGLKEGKWEEGIIVCCNETTERHNDIMYDLIRPYLAHIYKEGIEINQFKDISFWPIIEGNWHYYHDLKPNRLVFSKTTGSRDLNFANSHKVFFRKAIIKDHSRIVKDSFTSEWIQQSDLLIIQNEQISMKFKVLRLDHYYLIVERLH